ncbi:MAG: hypothetical protein J6R42_01105 [Clostridia bacterium]|nr:hypothetical protein [Clostridia bacterium]
MNYISLSIYILAAYYILTRALRGRKKGAVIATIRLVIFVGVSGFLAYMFHHIATFDVLPVVERFASDELADKINLAVEELSGLEGMVIGLPLSLLAPACFLPLVGILSIPFHILFGILHLMYKFVTAPLGKRKPSFFSRLIGTVVGGLHGVAVVFMLVLPMVVYGPMSASIFDAADAYVAEDNQNFQDLRTELDDLLRAAEENPVVQIAMSCGAQDLAQYITSFTFTHPSGKDYTINIPGEIDHYANVAKEIALLRGTPVENYGEAELAALERIATELEKSEGLAVVLSGVLSRACTDWSCGDTFMNEEKPTSDDVRAQKLIDASIEAFKDSTPESVDDDIRSLVDAFSVLVKYDALSALLGGNYDSLNGLLSDQAFFTELMDALQSSQALQTILDEVVKVSLQSIMESEALESEAFDQAVDELTTTLADQLNQLSDLPEEERDEALKGAVYEVLEENGVDAGENNVIIDHLIDDVTKTFADEIDAGTITPEDIAEYLSFVKAGAE